jgi:hypothetical protein
MAAMLPIVNSIVFPTTFEAIFSCHRRRVSLVESKPQPGNGATTVREWWISVLNMGIPPLPHGRGSVSAVFEGEQNESIS